MRHEKYVGRTHVFLIGSSGQSSPLHGQRIPPFRRQQAIGALHLLPVIFVGGSAREADLIMLAIAAKSWPRKPVGAEVSEQSLKEFHVVARLRAGPDSMARSVFEEWRVNRLDYDPGTLSNYGSACRHKLLVVGRERPFASHTIARLESSSCCGRFREP